jgi:hypothetical protein
LSAPSILRRLFQAPVPTAVIYGLVRRAAVSA